MDTATAKGKRTSLPQQYGQKYIPSDSPHLYGVPDYLMPWQESPTQINADPENMVSAIRILAKRLTMGNTPQLKREPTPQDVVARAVEILASKDGDLTSEEIMRRLNEVKNLLQGVRLPRRARGRLDRALMDIAIREPNATKEARVLIGGIFEQLAPISGINNPKRDEPLGLLISQDTATV